MDKYEYKVRADEIKSLIAEGEYAEAAKIADTIDWRRVKSIMMLCTISDLYKINRRYEDSRDILLLAYERHAGGRLIVYSLCELSIKLEEYVQAVEYYKEFVQLAPKDSGRYVLQYKLYEAQEVSLEERISVLEELKKKDYRERWAYELANMYHRIGLETKCVEECDEMFLWFGDGKYILKALELKKLHQPLTEEQQKKYEQMKQTGGTIESDFIAESKAIKEEAERETEDEEDDEFSVEMNVLTDPTQEIPKKELDDIQVKTVDISQYNTINLQRELAESMKEFLDSHPTAQMPIEQVTDEMEQTKVYAPVSAETSSEEEEMATDNQEEAEESLQKPKVVPIYQDTDEMQLISEDMLDQPDGIEEKPVSEEVFFGNTAEVDIEDVVSELVEKDAEAAKNPTYAQDPETEEKPPMGGFMASPNPAISNTGVIRTFHKPSGYDDMLSQEYDGQLSLVVPEQEKIEKQITGQLSIDDVMAEWERMKKEKEQKMLAEIKERVHKQTDALFADFDESTKSGLLEELERAMMEAAVKDSRKKTRAESPKIIKISDMESDDSETIDEEPADEDLEIEDISLEESSVEETDIEEILPEEDDVEKEDAGEEDIEDEDADEELMAEEDIEEEEQPAEGDAEEEEQPKEDSAEDLQEESQDESEALAESKAEDTKQTQKQPETDGEETKEEEKQKENLEEKSEGDGKYTAREMSQSEKEQFAPFINHKRTRRQIVEAIDNISMASYTGNVVITGEEGTTALAKLLVKEIQLSDNNFSGKVAKISGTNMNKKDISSTLSKMSGGALIIEGAAVMKKSSVDTLVKELNQEGRGLIVLLEDKKETMDKFLTKHTHLAPIFNLRVDVEALDDQTLVKYAKKYALDQEYSIDDLGILALHTRIAEMQTSDHEVTLAEIEELVDEAIYFANKKTPGHFFDVLLGKRYDEEDMIVLREKDFMHY